MKNAFIFHGTEGYPEENWFPWMRSELEHEGFQVFVPQFPSPPVVPAQIDEWLAVLDDYRQHIGDQTILIGHSLGGVFTLRILEQLDVPVRAACFVGTPVGVQPITFYDRDVAFSGFAFDWETIKQNASDFVVFQSDNDPFVSLGNGEALARKLGVGLQLVPGAGHFNAPAGYLKFEALRDWIVDLDQA